MDRAQRISEHVPVAGLTHNEAHFTELVVVAAGHHGSHRVIDHSHDVGVKVLQGFQTHTSKSKLHLRASHRCMLDVGMIIYQLYL